MQQVNNTNRNSNIIDGNITQIEVSDRVKVISTVKPGDHNQGWTSVTKKRHQFHNPINANSAKKFRRLHKVN